LPPIPPESAGGGVAAGGVVSGAAAGGGVVPSTPCVVVESVSPHAASPNRATPAMTPAKTLLIALTPFHASPRLFCGRGQNVRLCRLFHNIECQIVIFQSVTDNN